MIAPVTPIAIDDIEAARKRIAGTVLRTPLVRLDLGSGAPEIWLKLENLQPTNAYKIRGATNAIARLSDEERARGVWTISAGNAGQGVAYAARKFGIPATVVAIETAPQTKLDRMRALGATIVPVSYEQAWVAAEAHAFEGLDGTFVHPFDNHDFIAGHGTMGLEILEDLPGRAHGDLRDRRRRPDHRRRKRDQGEGAGREGARRRARDGGALRAVAARRRPAAGSRTGRRRSSMARAAKASTERMWRRMRPVTDGTITVTLDQTRESMRLIAEKSRTIAEGAGALSLAAALTGEAGEGPIVCVVSGGNIDLDKFAELVS